MTYLIIAVAVLAFVEVITLPFVGKRAKKEKTEQTEQKPNHRGWEASAIEYNRIHGLPDDAI